MTLLLFKWRCWEAEYYQWPASVGAVSHVSGINVFTREQWHLTLARHSSVHHSTLLRRLYTGTVQCLEIILPHYWEYCTMLLIATPHNNSTLGLVLNVSCTGPTTWFLELNSVFVGFKGTEVVSWDLKHIPISVLVWFHKLVILYTLPIIPAYLHSCIGSRL